MNGTTGTQLIKECISNGYIFANRIAGGIIGYNISGKSCKIDKCVNKSNVIAKSVVGGIIGRRIRQYYNYKFN